MNTYELQIQINYTAHISALDAQFGNHTGMVNTNYNAKIIYDCTKPNYLQLVFFYPSMDRLFEKMQFLHEQNVDILKGLIEQPARQNNYRVQSLLDVSNSKLLRIEEDYEWEQGNKPVKLIIDDITVKDHGSFMYDGLFHLNANAFYPIKQYINYEMLKNHNEDKTFIFQNNNRKITFGDVCMELSINHNIQADNKFKLELSRFPYLILHEEQKQLTDSQLIDYADIICLLLSLYWNKPIDYYLAKVRIIDNPDFHTSLLFKYSNHLLDDIIDEPFKSKYTTV
jgi:hypothetical protein